MSKGRYAKKKSGFPLLLIPIVLIVLAIAVILYLNSRPVQPSSGTEGESAPETEEFQQTTGQEQTEDTEDEPSSAPEKESSNTTAPTDAADATTVPQNKETQGQQTIVPKPTVEIIQQADAEYESWLAAAMVVSISMEYQDFEIEAIYAASATKLADKYQSAGAYVIFTTEGRRVAIHSTALEAERTARGTMDISTEGIGYATFDQIDPASVDFTSMQVIALEDLSELISQSLLVSIYAR